MAAKVPPTNTTPSDEELQREPVVTKRLGISRSLFWRWIKEGKAPQGIKLGPRITVWKKSDIDELINQLINENESKA